MNLLTRLFALHFDRSFSGKGWRQLAWLFGVIVTVFLLIYLVSFAFIFPEPSLEEWTGIDKDVPMGRLLQLICSVYSHSWGCCRRNLENLCPWLPRLYP